MKKNPKNVDNLKKEDGFKNDDPINKRNIARDAKRGE